VAFDLAKMALLTSLALELIGRFLPHVNIPANPFSYTSKHEGVKRMLPGIMWSIAKAVMLRRLQLRELVAHQAEVWQRR